MTLRERLKDDTTAAMRSGDALRRDVLRMVQNAVYNIDKAKHTTMSDDEIVGVISREVKTRRESVEAFRGRRSRGPRDEGRGRDRDPPRLPPRGACPTTELQALVDEGVAATGASSARDLGKVMGWLSPKIRGRADGKVASGLVAQALARVDVAAHDTGH